MSRKAAIIGCLLLGSILSGRAQEGIPYDSAKLSELAQAVRPKITALGCDTCYTGEAYKGYPIAVEQRRGRVTHLGIRLFDPEFKRLAGRELCDFAERYLLERIAFGNDPEHSWIYDIDSVTVHGNCRNLLHADRESVRFSIADTENRGYRLAWTQNDTTLLTITLPAQWQLICGKNLIELEQEFERELKEFDSEIPALPNISVERMEKTMNRNILVYKRGYYLIPQMVSSLYFWVDNRLFIKRSKNPGVRFLADMIGNAERPQLLSESSHPAESSINLLSVPALGKDYTVAITQRLLGYTDKFFDVPLDRLTAYCLDKGCRPYVGIKQIDEHTVTALCIMVNERWGYTHIFDMTLPVDGFDRRSGNLQAKMNLYAPTHNLKSLYDDEQQNRRGPSNAPKIKLP